MKEQPLAFHDLEFLKSPDARPIRIVSEYLEPARRFRNANIQDTVVFFGSARTLSREGAERELARLGTSEAKKAADAIGEVTVDMGDTACKVPLASDYIAKIEAAGRVGKKRKTARS